MSIKMKYNLLYFFYCVAGCCFAGFVAVFLQYKGVSNTAIGIVTGSGCVTSIFLAPYFSSLVLKFPNLNAKKMINIIYIFLTVFFTLIVFVPMPSTMVMLVYTVLYAIYLSTGPFLQMLASDYMQVGIDVNFGMARGLGSTAWAISALGFGFLIDLFNPTILVLGMGIAVIVTLAILYTMPDQKVVETDNKRSGSMLEVAKKYRLFFILLLGFSLMLSAATSLGTYLINIVKSLGGDTSFYGIAVFLMAISEMPVMALTPRLLRRLKSVHLICFAGICYILRNFLICLAPNMVVLCLGMLFQGLSFGLMTAVITYYVMYNLAAEDQVRGQTMITVMTSGFGSMIGNLLGGVLQDNFGLNAMYIFIYTLTIMGALLIAWGWHLSRKEKYRLEIKR